MKGKLFKQLLLGISAVLMLICFVGSHAVMGAEKLTIRIMGRQSGTNPETRTQKALFKEFEEQHPNVIIQDDSIAEENAQINKLKADIATGNPPHIFYFPGVAGVTDWAKAGILADVTPLVEGDKDWADGFIDGSFEIWNLEKYGANGLWAVPYSYWPEVIFYNAALFEKAGITEVPETMEDLYTAIDKLNAAGITPWGAGAKDIWRTGHIFNNIIYKYIGVDGVKAMGAREAKWTDPDVVEALQVLLDLKKRGAFEKGFEGVDYGTETAGFKSGKYAMICNGAWAIGDFQDSELKEQFKFFTFPYFKDRPQFKGDTVLFTSAWMVRGNLTGEEKAMTEELVKFLTSKYGQGKYLAEAQRFPTRKDIDPTAMDLAPLTKDVINYMGTITVPGGDYSDYDTCTPLLEKSRSAIIGMLLEMITPEQAAQDIQREIDACERRK